MLRIAFACLVGIAASPAAAFEICDEMWFIRNLEFDRAGYCFGSVLGQTVFDSTGCAGKSVTLTAEAQRIVDGIAQQEKWLGCAVNTAGTRLDVPHMHMLRALDDLPIPTDTASGCLGWRGPDVPLHSGHTRNSPVVAVARGGVDIVWEYDHVAPEPWQFLSLYKGGDLVGMGWSDTFVDEGLCTNLAG